MKIVERGIVSRITDSFFSYQAWPSACTDENGVIYIVCSGFRMGHLCPFGKTVMYKSRDNGKSFSLPVVINDHYLDDRDPGIIYLGGGKMLVTRCSHPADAYTNNYADWIFSDSGEAGKGLLSHYPQIPENDRTGGCFYRILYDYGEKASEEKRIPVHSPHGPIILSNGNIFYLGKELFSSDKTREDLFSVYISRDSGESFEKAGECGIPDGYEKNQFHEVHCAEMPDGKIIALFRSHLTEDDSWFTLMKSYSDDGGKHWSNWEKTGICGSPAHLCRISSGLTALTYGRRVPPYGIYARTLNENGEIQDNEFCLAECGDNDIGYPATVELKDGTLFTVYYSRYENDGNASLLYTRWTP